MPFLIPRAQRKMLEKQGMTWQHAYVLSMEDVASLLGASISTVSRWTKTGDRQGWVLTGHRFGTGSKSPIGFSLADFDAFVTNHTQSNYTPQGHSAFSEDAPINWNVMPPWWLVRYKIPKALWSVQDDDV